jgi:outer membrane protein assembly factor BamB
MIGGMKTRRSLVSWGLASLMACTFAATSIASDDDAIDGRWRGEVAFGSDHVDVAFDFRRNDHGDLVAYAYQPMLNAFDVALPGKVVREERRFVNHEYALSLARVGEGLEGTMSSLALPVKLRRTEALPAEVPVPEVPTGPGPRWRTKLGAPIYAAAAVRDGVAYVGTTGGVFQAVKIADGKLAWTFAAGRAVHGEALVTPDHVYFACDSGFLYKLERANGKEVWRYDLGDAQVGRVFAHPAVFDYDFHGPRPLLDRGIVYVGSGDGALHAVDDATGARRFRYDMGGKVRVSAVWLDGTVMVGSMDGKVAAIDAATGAERWARDLKAPVTTAPAIVDGKLIVGTRGSVLYALRPATGETIWRDLFWGSWVESEAVTDAGTLYIGSSDLRRVSAIDPRDGRIAWRTDVFGSPWGRPAITTRRVYVGAVGTDPYAVRHLGSVVALERDGGRIAWRWPAPATPGALHTGFAASPVIDGDTMVIGGLDGTLYAFGVN